jgi:hypothetical protein
MEALTNNLVISDGRVVGTWKPEQGAGRVRVAVSATRPVDEEALQTATEQYSRFLGLPAELVLIGKSR